MFKELNPLLHGELRLGIMSILLSVESAEFKYIREQTGATAGNLSVQLDKLSQAGYITIEKGYRGKVPCTTCRITEAGITAFREYVEALKTYINIKKNAPRLRYKKEKPEVFIDIFRRKTSGLLLCST